MKYCKYCGKQLADDQLCNCEAAKAERDENLGSKFDSQRAEKEVFEPDSTSEEDYTYQRVNQSTEYGTDSSSNSDQVTINIDVESFKSTINKGLNAFRNPYSFGLKYINSLNYKNSIIVMLISALVTALFGLIVSIKFICYKRGVGIS